MGHGRSQVQETLNDLDHLKLFDLLDRFHDQEHLLHFSDLDLLDHKDLQTDWIKSKLQQHLSGCVQDYLQIPHTPSGSSLQVYLCMPPQGLQPISGSELTPPPTPPLPAALPGSAAGSKESKNSSVFNQKKLY